MFTEDDLLPLSALQHLLFCERQCALIHVERLWEENSLTVEGQYMHAKAHEGPNEVRHGVRVTRGLPLRSLRLGLAGKADVVEFRAAEPRQSGESDGGVMSHGTHSRRWIPFPVEYKRGRPKRDESDRVQLCAQALCLEEMLNVDVPCGALFYGRTRRRFDVVFDPALRDLTEVTAKRLHELVDAKRTPSAVREPKCARCSLLTLCLPDALGPRRSASRYMQRSLASALTAPPLTD